ncbi:MAG: M28 family metallopeptidase [Longimicrobiales bacterium]
MSIRNTAVLLLAGVAVAGCASQAPPALPGVAPLSPAEQAEATITANDMYARIAFLADDALRGRDTPSRGLDVAAAYLSSEFQRMGLEPAGDQDSYIQMYPYTARRDQPRAGMRAGDTRNVPNVVAILPGSDPVLRDTYIVLSAHFDHVGVGTPDASGDSIYNGADDDASGTSGMLEVAEAFASLPVAPRRSLVFLAVSGEEKGLLGSRWYSDHPTVPIEQIVANVNLDMIGRNAPDSIVVIGQEFSSLGPLIQQIAEDRPELGLTVAEDIWPEQNFFFRSDHFNFARKEIPALFFFAGVHEDYHQPSDHVEKIDADKAARIARLVYWLTSAVANDPQAPEWTDEGLARVRELTQ